MVLMALHRRWPTAVLLAGGLVALAFVATACVSSATVHFKGIAPLNPGTEFGDEARPIPVRIYQLKDDANFEKASHEDLWERANDTLKGDAIGDPKTVTVNADESKEITIEVETGTRFIGVLALFKPDPKRKDSQYRKVLAVREVETVNLVLTKFQVITEPRR